jgi:hypothetical protein
MKTLGAILLITLFLAAAFAIGYEVGSIYKIDSDEKLIRDMIRLIEDQKKLIDELNAKSEVKPDD